MTPPTARTSPSAHTAGTGRVAVIIPALNEAGNIAHVLGDIPDLGARVIVVDNGSTDGTADVARGNGAEVITEPIAGYGRACLTGIAALTATGQTAPDIVVFLDGDYSDYPEQMEDLIAPIRAGTAQMVIGSRLLGARQKGGLERGAMTAAQKFGNRLAPWLIKLFWGHVFTDLGPFRAIRYDTLMALNMQDLDFGWTVEMQIKAARNDIRSVEIPVNYRPRLDGRSKVSGTLSGTVRAGTKILWLLFKAGLYDRFSGVSSYSPASSPPPASTTRK